MSHFTILGAGGTIGRALAQSLAQAGHRVTAVTRFGLPAMLASDAPAGHVIDCIGLTGDFRSRPMETMEAHVGVTAACLTSLRFTSFLFLSSTRVYQSGGSRGQSAQEDDIPLDLYNLSKLAGESLCLQDKRPSVRVVRLSNVYGPRQSEDTFLGQVLAEGRRTGAVVFRQAPESEKDYIALDTVCDLLPTIARHGAHRLYNVAAGRNTTHADIAATLRARFGWRATFAPGAETLRFPPINISRIVEEFRPALNNLSYDLSKMAFEQEALCSPSTRQAAA